ncbi:hypothetical protein HI914_03750 [Erysiphe necator]|uniref:Helix-turn-helix-domain containing protein type n=1 Tax=Uncinula necator TaxID=52586 RepID=A0A0B1P6H4_UNCNE|nr:hypothetical protein HI914_03750 [Erysiphe necator]KHJ32950.1 hypothetical protein EV44_g0738 [Erysiphe necator]
MPSLYEISIPVFTKKLKSLSKIMEKGAAHEAVSNDQLVNTRLIADMENFTFQIQKVTDAARFVAERLGKITPIEYENNEKTYEELQERVKKTIEILESVKESDFGSEEDDLSFTVKGYFLKHTGKSFILEWITPNFYFHLVTAYALLRKEGVNIGKRDFLF